MDGQEMDCENGTLKLNIKENIIMDKACDFSSKSQHGQKPKKVLQNIIGKQTSLKIAIGCLCIILIYVMIHFIFSYLKKENNELRSKIDRYEIQEKLNAKKLIAYEVEVNRTKTEINNITFQLNEERLNTEKHKNNSNYLKEANEQLNSRIENDIKLEKINAEKYDAQVNRTKQIEDEKNELDIQLDKCKNDSKIAINLIEQKLELLKNQKNDEIENLENKNKELKDEVESSNVRYQNLFYENVNKEASLRGGLSSDNKSNKTPLDEDNSSMIYKVAAYFSKSTANHNDIHTISIIILPLLMVLFLKRF